MNSIIRDKQSEQVTPASTRNHFLRIAEFHDSIVNVVDSVFFSSDTPKDMCNDFRLLEKKVSNLANNKKGGLCLDLGCGHGHFVSVLEKLMSTIGVDFSPGMIRQAASRHSKSQFILANICELPFRRYIGDLIVVSWVVEFILDCDTLRKFLFQIRQTLNPTGTVLFADSLVCTHGETDEGIYESTEEWMEMHGLRPMVVKRKLWRPNTFERIISEAGLQVSEYLEGNLNWIMVCEKSEN